MPCHEPHAARPLSKLPFPSRLPLGAAEVVVGGGADVVVGVVVDVVVRVLVLDVVVVGERVVVEVLVELGVVVVGLGAPELPIR